MLSGRAKLPDEATMIKEMEAFYDLRSSHKVPKRYTPLPGDLPLLQHSSMLSHASL